jgi:hypothetical protein
MWIVINKIARFRCAVWFTALSLAWSVVGTASAVASKMPYGPEFTFTHADMLAEEWVVNGLWVRQRASNVRWRLKYETQLEALCSKTPGCKKLAIQDRGVPSSRFTFRDGFWIQVTCDPLVIEVSTQPQTYEQFKARRRFLQRWIFDSAGSIGLYPHERFGDGHINGGFSTVFKNAPLRFRNYLVFFANHPELAHGIFRELGGSGPPIAALMDAQREAFREVIARFDRGEIRLAADLAHQIVEQVYTADLKGDPNVDTEKYQQLNLNSIVYEGQPWAAARVENRGFRPQRSMQHFLANLSFLEGVLGYVSRLREPLELKLPSSTSLSLLSLEEKWKRFWALLKLIGVDAQEQKRALEPDWSKSLPCQQIWSGSSIGSSFGASCVIH